MKKKIAMLLAAALCMGTFAGCGNSTSNNSSAADNNTTNNTAAATESSDVTASADNVKIDTLNVYFVPSRDPDEIVTATRDFALKNKSPCSACEFQAKQGISILGIKLLFFSV